MDELPKVECVVEKMFIGIPTKMTFVRLPDYLYVLGRVYVNGRLLGREQPWIEKYYLDLDTIGGE